MMSGMTRLWRGVPVARLATLGVSILLFLLASACLEHDQNIRVTPSCEFAGITVVTEDGSVLQEDPNDWCAPPGDHPGTGLYPARPNPSSGAVEITFSVADSTAPTVLITVIGPECVAVRTLASESAYAGMHAVTWDRKNSQGELVPPGIYRCRMVVQGAWVCDGDIQIL